MTLKKLLKDDLNDYEIRVLKRSFEVVGDIAILEIPEELVPKEKIIAKAVLQTHKNINTVVKKDGNHYGVFRLQKHKFLAGVNTKETTYKENGCKFNINIDETYFSTKLSTERQRVLSLVKKDEDVLVMFSGIAPYPITISKNTNARIIYGIELNPQAHKKAIENIQLNKARNVILINDDASKVENFYTLVNGIKTSINKDEFNNKYNIIKEYNDKPIIELFINKESIKNFDKKTFNYIKDKSSKLILHGLYEKYGASKESFLQTIKETHDFIEQNNLLEDINHVVIHLPRIDESESRETFFKTRQLIKTLNKDFVYKTMFENMPWGYFSEPENIKRLLRYLGKIDKMCYDVGHHCISLQNQNKEITYNELKNKIDEFLNNFEYKNFHLYFHTMNVDLDDGVIEDHKEINDTLLIKDIKEEYFSKLTYGILENINKDERIANETKRSLKYLDSLNQTMHKSFDRIIMPLPKESELFLKYALSVSKQGTIIHLYHFCHIDELEKFKDKIREVAKNNGYKIVIREPVRCGDFSPKVHRWSLDIEIL